MLFSRLLFAFFLAMFSVQADALEIKQTEIDRQEIWYSQNSLNPIISIKIAFKNAGTANDPDDKLGLANFVTAMLNEGAGDVKSEEFLQTLEDNSISFYPSADLDNFYISIKALSSNLEVALELLNLAITKPNFEKNDFERIKEQLLTGLKKKSENVGDVAQDEFKKQFFAGHKYAKNSDGSVESVSKMLPQDLHDFVERSFAKNNFVIGISGDVTEESAKQITSKILSGLQLQSAQESTAEFTNYPAAKTVEIEKDFPQTVIMFGKKGLARDDEDFYAGYVLNQVFGGSGFQSRLYKEVREKRGLTYYSGSSMQSYDSADIVLGSVATQTSKKQESIDVIREEIAKIGSRGVTAEELDSAKKYVIGAYPFSLDSSSAMASHIVSLQLDGLPIDYATQRDKFFSDVTLEKANDLAKNWFGQDDWFFISVGRTK